ncbi:sensor histidine kinase [Actinoplanes couchii]|uniref:histidine kinase n=1 Tax=Actinoplanes couchii TaxID=403638 RepID=A0ABQ3XMW0_9ACTN|nr:HAMP domain-containing sensor histidine kinase [Actinoplanes couchii]MDR6317852.1 signal transduction histidine kinase [Actinoplanes couchii]GID59839.1 two-component sensor histidine kinase [Actinoplanes couchii]
MIRQLVVSYVVLVAIAIAAFTVPVAWLLTDQLHEDAVSAATREADTAALLVAVGDAPSRQALASLTEAYQRQTPGRLDVVFGTDGPSDFDRALAGERVVSWGHQPVLGADGLMVVVPARADDGTIAGAVRVTYPSAPMEQRQWQIWGFRAGLAVAVLIAAALLGLLLARRVTSPLRALTRMAGRLRDGDLTVRVEETGPVEVRTLARTLNTAAGTIDGLVGSQRTFIADASHQLRTPLTALRLSLDNIADEADDPALRDDVDLAAAEVVRMSRLVNGLLALARAEGHVSAPEAIRTSDVIDERLDVWRAAADEKGVRLHRPPGSGPAALITRGNLEQILDNLLANALEVSSAGDEITVAARRTGSAVTVTVRDQGPGIPADLRDRAFDRFWRGGDRPGGSGLGLAIVKQLVEDDGGAVRLLSPDGPGLIVELRFLLGHG